MGSLFSTRQAKSKVCYRDKSLVKYPNGNSRHLAFVGATITLLMLLFDPFLQQVVVYPDRLVPSGKAASIARAQQYQARSDEGLPLPSTVDMSMKVCT